MALAQYLQSPPLHSPYSDSLHIFRVCRFPTHVKMRTILGQIKASTPPCVVSNMYKKARWRFRVFYTGKDIDGRVQNDEIDRVNVDAMLAIAEVLCIAPSAVLAFGCAVYSLLWNSNSQTGSLIASLSPLGAFMNKIFVLQTVFLVGAVAIGALIRRRQWQRISRDSVKMNSSGFNLIERIEKLEEDLRSSTTIVRVLSRQLEKLGIRFRVTRKALKEPITETAALAQKNSEATRALAMQEDILEKELGEIQKVLLAMQEQQQKQLELILAIGKAGKLRGNRRDFVAGEQATGTNKSITGEVKQMENQAWIHKEPTNERVST